MMATPLNRCEQPLSPGVQLCQTVWYPPISTSKWSPSSHVSWTSQAHIILTHFVNQIFQVGCVRGGVEQYISIWVLWATPEALFILVVQLGLQILRIS